MNWRAIFLGAVGLAVLEAVPTRKGGAQQVGGALTGAAGVVEKFISPAVPAFASAGASTTSATTMAATTAALPAYAAPSSQVPVAQPAPPSALLV